MVGEKNYPEFFEKNVEFDKLISSTVETQQFISFFVVGCSSFCLMINKPALDLAWLYSHRNIEGNDN